MSIYDKILEAPTSRAGSGRSRWRDIPCGLAIGTCNLVATDGRPGACCFYWALCVDGELLSGRELEELADVFVEMSEAADAHLMVVVQDTAEFFQYFRKWCDPLNLFAAQARTPLNFEAFPGIHIRSGEALSGMSLQENSARFGFRSRPRSYEFPTLTPTSALSLDAAEIINEEAETMCALCREHIERCEGSAGKVPLTKTGYVRKKLRNRILYGTGDGTTKKDWYRAREYRKAMHGATMCPEEYRILSAISCGGLCEANRYKLGEIILDPVYCDRKSAYPAHIVYDYVPAGRGTYTEAPSMEKVRALPASVCFAGVFRFRNVKGRDLPFYYLREKYCYAICEPVNIKTVKKYLQSADEITVALTELDLQSFDESYTYDKETAECLGIVTYQRGQVPGLIKKYTLARFRGKEAAKTKEERRVQKEQLNSIYGIMCMDPVRESYEYSVEGAEWDEPTAPDVEEALEKYNTSNSRWTCYPWGIWIAAHCRRMEWRAFMELSPWFVYGDTDSIYLTESGWTWARTYFEEENAKMYERAKQVSESLGVSLAFFKPFGELLGTWTFDTTISRLCIMGQKNYITETRNGKLTVVIAGINPDLSSAYIQRRYGGAAVEAFRSIEYYPARWRDLQTGRIMSATGRRICFHFDDEFEADVVDALGELQHVKTLSGTVSLYVPVRREEIEKYEEKKNDASVDVIPEILP